MLRANATFGPIKTNINKTIRRLTISMKKKKKKYVKPAITVAEWDFNESVCALYNNTPCIHVIGKEDSNTRADHVQSQTNITWTDWNGTSNNRY